MKKRILVYIVSSCIALSSLGQVNYQWVKSVGGYNPDKGTSIATDGSGNVYVSTLLSLASLSTVDFDPYGTGSGSYNFSPSSSGNCVIAKYDAEGNCLWRSSFTSDGFADVTFFVTSVAVSADGLYLYVAGGFQGTVNFGSTSLTSATSMKPFIAQYDAGTGAVIWVNDLGLANLVVKDIAPVGSFVCLAAITGTDAIFGKCDNSNGNVIFVDTLTGPAGSTIIPYDIELDANSNIGITGSFTGTIDFDGSPGVATKTSSGLADIFIAKYSLGGDYKWANSFGGSLNDVGTSIAFNSAGDSVYVAGVFQDGANFGSGALTVIGANNGFIVKCDNDDFNNGALIDVEEIRTLNPTDSVICSAISLDAQDNVFIAGAFKGRANVDYTSSNDTLRSNGGFDLFFAKYNAGLEYGWSRSIGGSSSDGALDLALRNEGVYLTGYYNDSVDFNTSNGFANRKVNKDPQSSDINDDIFILKYALGNATIKGSVTYGPNNDTIKLGNDNLVRLYTQTLFDGNIAMKLIAETTVDGFGNYIFNTIPDGEYLALAVPGSNYAAIAAPSYYSLSSPYAVQWENADTIPTQSTSPAFVADIKMFKYPVLPFGTGVLSGQVIQLSGFDRTAGTPIGGTDVGLDGVPGGRLITTQTDDAGNYQFDSIPSGCYRIYVNVPGLPMDSTHNRCVDSAEMFVDLDFFADSNSIYIESAQTGIEYNVTMEAGFITYPNPYNNSFIIEYTLKKATDIDVEIYNLLGEKIAEFSNNYSAPGVYKQVIDTSDKGLKAGVYLMNVRIGNEAVTKRIVQVD